MKDNILLALFIGIIGIMSFVPFLGYITTGGISITTIHVPLIIGAIALGKTKGAIIGLAFGLFNLAKAYTSGTPEALIFMDPMISVLPRVLAGFFIGLFFEVINNFENRRGAKATKTLYYVIALLSIALVTSILGVVGLAISSIIATIIYFMLNFIVHKFPNKFKMSVILTSITGTLIHTVLVLVCIGIFAGNSLLSVGENIIAIFQIVVLMNVVFEILIAAVIVPSVVVALSKGRFINI